MILQWLASSYRDYSPKSRTNSAISPTSPSPISGKSLRSLPFGSDNRLLIGVQRQPLRRVRATGLCTLREAMRGWIMRRRSASMRRRHPRWGRSTAAGEATQPIMRRSSSGIAKSTCALPATSTLIFGDVWLFQVTLETNPNTTTPCCNFPGTVPNFPAQYTLNVDWPADVNPSEKLEATVISWPCSVPCTGNGAVKFVSDTAAYDATPTDDIAEAFRGLTYRLAISLL